MSKTIAQGSCIPGFTIPSISGCQHKWISTVPERTKDICIVLIKFTAAIARSRSSRITWYAKAIKRELLVCSERSGHN